MCNLYSMTKSREAVRRFAKAATDMTDNQPPLPVLCPDQLASVVGVMSNCERRIEAMRWGCPLPRNLARRPVTNLRNAASPYWRAWLKPQFRCLVQVRSFCEYADRQPKVPHWFALDRARPLFVFADIWWLWTGARKGEAGAHRLFAFLTIQPNAAVRPSHAKAMPVILTGDDCDAWLEGDTPTPLTYQQPFPGRGADDRR